MASVLDFILTDREQKEVGFARVYVKDFNHGTPGHNAYVLIAKLADVIGDLESRITESKGVDSEAEAGAEETQPTDLERG